MEVENLYYYSGVYMNTMILCRMMLMRCIDYFFIFNLVGKDFFSIRDQITYNDDMLINN